MNQDPLDKYVKWAVAFAVVYFLGHVAYALASQTIVFTPEGKVVTCTTNGGYTTCL